MGRKKTKYKAHGDFLKGKDEAPMAPLKVGWSIYGSLKAELSAWQLVTEIILRH